MIPLFRKVKTRFFLRRTEGSGALSRQLKRASLLLLLAAAGFSLLLVTKDYAAEIRRNEEIANNYNVLIREWDDKINTLESLAKNELPGLVAWGDSLTAGAGGEGTTFPLVVEEMVKENALETPVMNMGVGGETSSTIVGRAGSIPYAVEAFTIPGDSTAVKVSFKSSNGHDVAPLKQGDKLNPVYIAGVEGSILIDKATLDREVPDYYFTRHEGGRESVVERGTKIIPAHVVELEDHLSIIFIGTNGGYDDHQELIDQIDSIVDSSTSDRYLVMGLTVGNAESQLPLETVLAEKYAEKFFNTRAYIVQNGGDLADKAPGDADKAALEIGAIPPSLLIDDVHFTRVGYEVIGVGVYNKLRDLGYLDNAVKYGEEIRIVNDEYAAKLSDLMKQER